MRIVIICVCQNHVDIVESSLRHNALFSDAIVVLERSSADRSPEVFAELHRSGLPIVALHHPHRDIDEAELVKRVCRNSRRFLRPDRIILLHGDEFIVCEDRSFLNEELREVGDSGAVVACRTLSTEVVNRVNPTRSLQGDAFSCSDEWDDLRVFTGEQVDGWEGVSPQDANSAGSGQVAKLESLFLAKAQVTGQPQLPAERQDRRPENCEGDADAYAASSPIDADPERSRSFGWSVATNRALGRERTPLSKLSKAEAQVAESGSLPVEFHRRNLYLDLPAFRYLWETYRPRTVLDLGCGLGGYIEMFRRWGAEEVAGADDFDEPEGFLAENSFLRLDLRKRFELGGKYDLVICTEVLEHIEESFESNVLANITSHARRAILFSAARPGQPGVGHINCKPPQYWLEKLNLLGWETELFDSLAVRSLSTFYWFRRNLTVLVPIGEQRKEHGFTEEDLESFEAQHAPWLGEAPRVYTFSLEVELPRLRPPRGGF